MTTPGKGLAFAVILCALWLVIAAVFYLVFVSDTDHTDFFPRWAGARLALLQSRDPYAPETTAQIQRMVYGHSRRPTEDQQGFAYPAHLIPLLLPFWLLPMRVSSALWSSSSVLMAGFLISTLAQVPRRLSWVPVLLVMTAHVLLAIFQGQFTVFVAACLGIGYWMYTHSRSTVAGLLLVGTTVKPELVLLPAVALLVIAVSDRRLKFLVVFCLGFTLTIGASIAVAGFWVPDWSAQMRAYQAYAQTVWPLETLRQGWPVAGLAGVILLALASRVDRWNRDALFASLCALNLILVPQTLPYSLAILLVPIALAMLPHSPIWAPVVTLASWGAIFLPYGIQMTAVPVIVLGFVFLAQRSTLEREETTCS